MQQRSVRSGEVTLAVREYGDADRPTLIAVHGYPDSQELWAPLAEHVGTRLQVVSYDVRGCGGSSAPRRIEGYRIARLVDDLVAVLDATAGGDPVHLLGHDWGSIQLWAAVTAEGTDPRLRGRIASFTSVSGPPLDHLAAAVRAASWAERLRQSRRWWYAYAFQLPVLPELAWRRLHRTAGRRLARAHGVPVEAAWGDELARDGANGVQLYRANLVQRGAFRGDEPDTGAPRRATLDRPARTRVPVQLVVPVHDPFVPPWLVATVASSVTELHRVELDAGHWVPRTHPEQLARLVTEWAQRH